MPPNGARIVLRAIVALISPIFACACLSSASALSQSAWATIPVWRNPVMRSTVSLASSLCAWAAASCAASCRVSSWTSKSPWRTVLPDSNEIFSTTPGRSEVTTTPCTAATLPIADSVAAQSCFFATTVVTASGGIWKLACCAMPFLIWPYFTAPIAVRNTAITRSIRTIRFFICS